MILYLLLPVMITIPCLFIGVFVKNNKVKNILICCVCGLILFLLSGLKSVSVGHDTAAYYEMFASLSKSGWVFKYQNFEFGYVFFAQVFAKIGLSFHVFTLFLYAIVYSLIGFFIYKTSDSPLIIFLSLFGLEFFAFSLSGQRQTISIAIALISIIFLEKKGIKNAIFAGLIILLSACFHKTALIFFVLFIGKVFPFNKKIFYYSVFILLIAFAFSKQIYQFFIFFFPTSSYLTIDNNGGGFFFMLLLLYCLTCLVFYRKDIPILKSIQAKKLIEGSLPFFDCLKSNYFNYLFYSSLLAVFFYASSPASSSFSRLSLFFMIPFAVLINNTIVRNFNKKTTIILLSLLYVSFYAIYYFTFIRTNYLEIIPYIFFF